MSDEAELSEYIIDTVEQLNDRMNSVSNIIHAREILDMIEGVRRGKKLRSVLCVLVSDSLKGPHDQALDLGLAVEFAHQASLIHDDIIDKDIFRRGVLSVPEQFGIGKAILAGDTLISFAMHVLKDIKPDSLPSVIKVLGKTFVKFSEGAFIENEYSDDYSEQQYISIIKFKTASLFQAATELGAINAPPGLDVDRAVIKENMKGYGYYTGVAFQIADDLTDYLYTTNEEKPIGDLKERRVTLPIILALADETDNKLVKKYISKEKMSDVEIVKMVAWLNKNGYIERTDEAINGYVSKAKISCDCLPESEYKAMLKLFPEYCVKKILSETKK